MAEAKEINAIDLKVRIVSISNDLLTAVGQVTISVTSSAEAEAYAAMLDSQSPEPHTHSGPIEYYLTLTGSGVFGDVLTYEAAYFKYAIEPKLVLAPPTGDENADEGTDTGA